MADTGAICGGVMSDSMMKRGMREHGPYFGMMAFVLPDKQYKRWVMYKNRGEVQKARNIMDRWAVSQI